jgi:hypothetical protein
MTLSLGLLGCGKTSTSGELNIEMYGVSVSPADAAGDQAPRWQEFKLVRASLITADGTPTVIHEETDPTAVRIIERPQIIFQKSTEDYENKYSGLSLDFAAAITGADRKGNELTATLPTTTLTLTQEIDLSDLTGSVTYVVKAAWNNTINSEGSMQAPSLLLTNPN